MRIAVTARSQRYAFSANPGEKILDAGLRARIALPYECASGTCGTCRAQMVEGDIDDPWPEAPGRLKLNLELGEFLMCQCTARTDCTVDVPSNVNSMAEDAFAPAHFSGVVADCQALTHDVVLLDIDVDLPLSFDAGQFVLIGVRGIVGRRAYSMVNYARPASSLRFVVKRKPGGSMSEWLFAGSAIGTTVSLFGPLGSAIFTPNLGKSLVCIAGGSGIAGFMSILDRACAEKHFDRYRGHVFFGVRGVRDLFFLDELAARLAQAAPSLEVTVAFSEDAVPESLRARHPEFHWDSGFVHEVAARRMTGRWSGVRAYLAGPPPMVDASIRVLFKEARLAPADIRYDKFS